jgi:hypothetical protein
MLPHKNRKSHADGNAGRLGVLEYWMSGRNFNLNEFDFVENLLVAFARDIHTIYGI